jgi:hypothetical protein
MKNLSTILKFLIITLMCCVIIENKVHAQVYGWSPMGSGVNGNVYAITMYNNRIIVAGSFNNAGGVSVNNIAQWDGSSWASLGFGFDGAVYALAVWNGELYAGGHFTHSASNNLNHIGHWNGSGWDQVGNVFAGYGVDGDVKAMIVYNGLVVGGSFYHAGHNPANNIARWNNGFSWYTFVNGLNDAVLTFTTYDGNLIVGGKFTQTVMASLPVNRIALWDESNWNNLSTGMDSAVYALTVYKSALYAGGKFTKAGGISASYVARWNNSGWAAIPLIDNPVFSLSTIKSYLVAGGTYHFAGSVYASRIALWDTTGNWYRMITGMNDSVNTLFVHDSTLYAGGSFTTAGGDYRNHISVWNYLQTYTINGQARYADSLTYVNYGTVQAVRMDVATREIIVVDSTHIIPNNNGTYSLTHIPPGDSLYIIIFPDDEERDNFVPTYHQSTIDWTTAIKVFPNGNLNNVDVYVIRAIPPGPSNPLNYNISGYVYLNFSPPFIPTQGYPFWNGSIVYAMQNNVYRGFGVSDINEHYTIPNMVPGTYSLFANRIGYNSGNRSVILGNANYDSANFWLDTFSVIGVQNINTKVPDKFMLYQNYPNPFNPSTIIRFSVQKTSDVKISVFNILGQEVTVLVNENLRPGEYKVVFNGSAYSSGVYFYRIETSSFIETKKMILIK